MGSGVLEEEKKERKDRIGCRNRREEVVQRKMNEMRGKAMTIRLYATVERLVIGSHMLE